MYDLVWLTAPPSASPDCKLAHNCVNYCVVSARYRRAFCVMHGLRPWYHRFYSLYSDAHLARVGFGEPRYQKWRVRYTSLSVLYNVVIFQYQFFQFLKLLNILIQRIRNEISSYWAYNFAILNYKNKIKHWLNIASIL